MIPAPKRNVLNSSKLDELKKKKQKVLKVKIIFLTCISVVIFVGLVILSRWEKLNIKNIVITGNVVVDTKDIEALVSEELAGKYLWLIPKTNFALYPKRSITASLEDKIKRLKDISINTKDPDTLEVAVGEREIKYTWCGDELPKEELGPEKGVCYFTDKNGYLFDVAPYFSGDVYFRFYGRMDAPLGKYFYPENFSKFVFYKDSLEAMDFDVVSMNITDDGEAEVFLASKSKPAPKVIIKISLDQIKVMENLQSALDTDFKNKLTTNYDKLRYIDLRFDNKVYYKFDD